MANGDSTPLIHWLWNAALTVIGGLLMMFVRDNKEKLDKKADKEVVDLKLDQLADQLESIRQIGENRAQRMEEHHSENTKRLDSILRELKVR